MSDSIRLALVGLDLGDGRLLRRWAEDGRLPNFRRLFDSGVTRPLASSADTLHVSAWPSLYTGAEPGEHGVYFTFQPVPGEQGHRRFHEGLYGRPTFWSLLGAGGVTATVLDAPYTHGEGSEGVVQIIDWGAWAQYLGPRSDPASAVRGLRRGVGGYPLGLEAHDVGFDEIAPETIGPGLVDAARAKTEAALWMIENHPAGAFVTVFGEPHAGAHYCWPRDMTVAEVHAALDDGRFPGGLDILRGLYEEIDRGLGRIREALPGDACLVVFSPDSITSTYGGWHLLPEVLRRLGYLAEPAPEPGDDGASAGGGLVRRVRDLLPKDFRKSLARRLPTAIRDRLARTVDSAFVDWERTRAFCLPTDLEGCIRINLEGREPLGIVPEREYDDVCERLTRDLRGLTDASGRRVVREVVKTRDRYPGGRGGHLPDLVVLWEVTGQLDGIVGEGIGEVREPSPDGRPGTHTCPGFLAAAGLDAERWAAVEDVRDVARVALESFDVAVPGYMRERRGDRDDD